MNHNGYKWATIFLFSLVVAVPPILSGGQDIKANFLLLALLLPLAYFVWKLNGGFKIADGVTRYTFIFLGIFLVGMAISILHSPEKYQAVETLIKFLAYSLLFFLIYNFITSVRQINYLAYLTIGIGIALSIIGIYNFIFSQIFGYLRLSSTFYYHIPFAEFLIYPMFLALALVFLMPISTRMKIWLIAINSLFFISFFFAHSRGAWLSFFIVASAMLFIFKESVLKRQALFALFTALLLAIGVIYGLHQIKSYQAAKYSRTVQAVNPDAPPQAANYNLETAQENALAARLAYWRGALEIWRDNPFLGSGLESYSSLYRQYLKPPFYYARDPHNFYLKILSEMGPFLLIIFLGFIASLFYYIFKLLRKINIALKDSRSLSNVFLVGMTGGVVSAIIHNAGNLGWSYPANAILFFIFSGVMLKIYTLNGAAPALSRTVSAKVIFITSGALFAAAWLFLISNFYYERGSILAADGKLLESLALIQRAQALVPINPEYSSAAASIYSALSEFRKAENYNRQAIRWGDEWYYYDRLAAIYLTENRFDDAEIAFRASIKKNPTVFESYIKLSQLYIEKERFAEIILLLENILAEYRKEYILSPMYLRDREKSLASLSVLHNIRGAAYFTQEEHSNAKADFEAAVSYFAENESARSNLAQVNKFMEGSSAKP